MLLCLALPETVLAFACLTFPLSRRSDWVFVARLSWMKFPLLWSSSQSISWDLRTEVSPYSQLCQVCIFKESAFLKFFKKGSFIHSSIAKVVGLNPTRVIGWDFSSQNSEKYWVYRPKHTFGTKAALVRGQDGLKCKAMPKELSLLTSSLC